jgi:hypothetical protein
MAKNHTFVYDTEPHEYWENYSFAIEGRLHPNEPNFYAKLHFSDIQHDITYYLREVAYYYDFKKSFEDYEDGYYQGKEKTFIIKD